MSLQTTTSVETTTSLGIAAGGLALLAFAALLVGVAKTSVGGLGMVAVVIFGAVLPSRASTGAILPLLLVGDVMAVRSYRAHADWRALGRLIPAVAIGVLLGVWFLSRVDDVVMRRSLGVVLLGLLVLQFGLQWRRSRPRPSSSGPAASSGPAEPSGGPHRVAYWGYGSLAGFTTMVANAGGATMSLYLLSARYSMLGFLGTYSWFFFMVNLFKLPFSVGLHLIDPASLRLDLLLAPVVVVGGLLGRQVISRLDQPLFERLVIASTAIGSIYLLR